MKTTFTLLLCLFWLHVRTSAQFQEIKQIQPVPVTTDTKDKAQSKIWTHDGHQWTVLTNNSGTFVWRLDNQTWTPVLQISPNVYAHADCKKVGNITHILLFRGELSQLFSVEYVTGGKTYKPWSVRPEKVYINLDNEVETGTIDLDGTGRMWLASDSRSTLKVRWSDSPYSTWSAPITLATGLNQDDIGAVIAMPAAKKIGVFWSNQGSQRFGFRTHADGTNPENWSTDEVPGIQSAQKINGGMADDHLNMAIAKDGTLYCAIKTSYDAPGYPKIGLLVRRPSGTWDNLYSVSETGTRPRVILSEELGRVKVIYSASEIAGDILYKESPVSRLSFCTEYTLISGSYNFATSSKENYGMEVAILASNPQEAIGVLATEKLVMVPDSSCGPVQDLVIYPNPLVNESTVSFTLQQTSDYQLTMYCITAPKFRIISNGTAMGGKPTNINLNGYKIPNGMYVVQLRTGDTVQSLRLVVDK